VQRFDGKVALVTGAASGIGRATATRLAGEGASVLAVDLDGAGLAETAESAEPGRIAALAADVRSPDVPSEAVDAALDLFGRLDVLANVAGVLRCSLTTDTTDDEWDLVLGVNLTGTFRFCRAALPRLVESQGAIVNVASTAALAGSPWMAAYAASKGGVVALTRTLAIEFGKRGVRANAVCPGSIDTPMTSEVALPEGADMSLVRRMMPLDTFRGPETVAAAIAFLASGDAAHINGETLRVDGATLS
jgi:meso-butanediol dehydrogenase/(S,S)-butanediol dehydrogenase/diacetyl reductase